MKRKRRKISPVFHVGVDLSLTQPGICVGTDPDNFKCTSVKTPPPTHFPHPTIRYQYITNNVVDHIISHIPKSTPLSHVVVFMEDYAHGAAGKTFPLAENGGLFKYKLIVEQGIKPANLYLVSIQHLKIFVTGLGNSGKDLMIKDVYKKWGFDAVNSDEADAYSLCMLSWCIQNMPEGLRANEKDAIQRVIEYNKPKTKTKGKK